jgi:hypothetical protein
LSTSSRGRNEQGRRNVVEFGATLQRELQEAVEGRRAVTDICYAHASGGEIEEAVAAALARPTWLTIRTRVQWSGLPWFGAWSPPA